MELEKRVEVLEAVTKDVINHFAESEVSYRDESIKLHRQHEKRYALAATLEVAGVWAIALALWFGA